MKSIKTLLSISLLITSNYAVAVAPKLSGNYVFSLSGRCQTTVIGSPITSVKPGDMSESIFKATFTPNVSGTAGSVKIVGYNDVGQYLLSETQGEFDVLTENAINKSGKYSNTATSLSISVLQGGAPSHIYYANIGTDNIAQYATFLNLYDDNNLSSVGTQNKCVAHGTLIRQ
ncbi:MAG: hypothetical protein PHU14_10240 [Methylovulum sp.]|nr:hypothetical protein [Methylovulum sp.]